MSFCVHSKATGWREPFGFAQGKRGLCACPEWTKWIEGSGRTLWDWLK